MKRVLLGLVTLGLAVGLVVMWSGLAGTPRAAAQPGWDVNQCDDNADNDADGAGLPGRINDGCPAVSAAESGAQCNNAIDDDADTRINDGCAAVGTQEEDSLQCGNNLDDDGGDGGLVNDGCPAVGPPEAGANCSNAVDDDADTVVNDGCPAAGTAQAEVTDACANATDDDDMDGKINDGCPAVGPAEAGADCDDAVDNDGDTKINDGCYSGGFNNPGVTDGDNSEALKLVGGVAEVPAIDGSAGAMANDSGGLSTGAYAAMAAGAVAAALVLSAGVVYARRRWLS